MLLSNAAVRAVAAGLVTLEFPREGELKAFSTSGSDALLADVLHELYGGKWRITAVPAGGRDQQESPGLAAGRADRVTERITGGAPGGTGPGGSGAPPGGSGEDGPRGGAAGRKGRTGAAPGGGGAGGGPGGGTGAAARGAGGGGGPGLTHGAATGGTRSAVPAGLPGHRAPGRDEAQVPAAVRLHTAPADDEPDPAGDADADAEMTGMELIQRELGGQIIGEIEDS